MIRPRRFIVIIVVCNKPFWFDLKSYILNLVKFKNFKCLLLEFSYFEKYFSRCNSISASAGPQLWQEQTMYHYYIPLGSK